MSAPGSRPVRAGRKSAARALPLAAMAAALAALAAGAAPSAGGIDGTYRLSGTTRIDAGAALSGEIDTRADAVLRSGPGPRAVRARLAAQGQACELAATIGEGGALAFEAGQRCLLDLRDPEASGHVEARLRAGRGRLRDRRLSLDLTWDLSGAVSLRTAQRVQVLGKDVELPAAWAPEIPVRGEAHARAEGDRDDSRAAER